MSSGFDYDRIFEDLPTPHMILDRDLRFVEANQAYLDVTLTTREQLIGAYVFDAFPDSEDRVVLFRSAFEEALADEPNTLIRKPFSLPLREEDGGGTRDVFWTCHHIPLHDENGEVCAMLQQANDVTEQIEAQMSRDVIAREFDHRIRNLLAKVTAIARRTGRQHQHVADFLPSFEQRIVAMARTQNLLVRTRWKDVELAQLAADEFAPYLNERMPKIRIDGPDVWIQGRIAQALGMAFHELATNAAKYGALATADGTIELSWRKETAPKRLVIEWIERGAVYIASSARTDGFGSTIIDDFTPRETGGTVERVFEGDTMRCTITLPETGGGVSPSPPL